MTKNGETLTYRVGQVEKQVEKLDGKIDAIMENHLPHIQNAVERNNTRIMLATAINVGAIVLGAALLKFL